MTSHSRTEIGERLSYMARNLMIWQWRFHQVLLLSEGTTLILDFQDGSHAWHWQEFPVPHYVTFCSAHCVCSWHGSWLPPQQAIQKSKAKVIRFFMTQPQKSHPHFCHVLLVTQAKADTMWERMTRGHEDQGVNTTLLLSHRAMIWPQAVWPESRPQCPVSIILTNPVFWYSLKNG